MKQLNNKTMNIIWLTPYTHSYTYICISPYIHGMTQSMNIVLFQRAFQCSPEHWRTQERLHRGRGHEEGPMKWRKFSWEKERAFLDGI